MKNEEKIQTIKERLELLELNFIDSYHYDKNAKCIIFYVNGSILEAAIQICKLSLPFQYRIENAS